MSDLGGRVVDLADMDKTSLFIRKSALLTYIYMLHVIAQNPNCGNKAPEKPEAFKSVIQL